MHVDGVDVAESDNLQILGSQGVVRKAAHVFQDHSVSLACVRSSVLPLFEYCTPVWGSACQSHLSFVDRVARRAESLCGRGGVGDLSHCWVVGLLSMLYNIYFNPTHPLRTRSNEGYDEGRGVA